MKLGAIRLIGVGLFLLFLFSVSLFQTNSKGESGHERSLSADGEVDQVMDFHHVLSEEDGFYKQVEHELTLKGYEYLLLGQVHAEDNVDLHIILTNREADKKQREEVIAIFREVALQNDLDPAIFQLEVSKETKTEEGS